MKRRFAHKKILIFSRWSRKKYATFASLGKVVNIARVSVSVCNQALKKTSSLTGLMPLLLTLKPDVVGREHEKWWQQAGISDIANLFNNAFISKKNISNIGITTCINDSYSPFFNLYPCFISRKAWIFYLMSTAKIWA